MDKELTTSCCRYTIYKATVYLSNGSKHVFDYGKTGVRCMSITKFKSKMIKDLNMRFNILNVTVKSVNLVYDEPEEN